MKAILYFLICLTVLTNNSTFCPWWPLCSQPESSKSILRQAIEANDYPRIKQLIAQGHDVNEEDESGVTALRKMVEADNEPTVHFLLDHGAKVGNSLFIAVLNRKDHMIRLLLKRGADPFADNRALVYANADILSQFMDYGLDIQANFTAIIDTLKENHSFQRSKMEALVSHSWANRCNQDYKKHITRLKLVFLMYNRPETVFNQLPREVVVHICSYLIGGFVLRTSNDLDNDYTEICSKIEVERRIKQMQKLLRTHSVTNYKQTLRDEIKKLKANPYVAIEEHSATSIINYLDSNKVTNNWQNGIEQQVKDEWKQRRINKKKRKLDEMCD